MPAACTNLGFFYSEGRAVAKDDAKANALYQKACDAGNADGCANLGYLMATGRSGPQNPVAATDLFRKACQHGVSTGCTNLAVMFLQSGVQ